MSPQHTFITSTIFTTQNNELSIFGKKISEPKEALIKIFEAYERGGFNGESGIVDTFFSRTNEKSVLTPNLLKSFDEFKETYNHTFLSADAVAEQMGNVDQRIIEYAKTCKNGEMTTKGFEKAIKGMSFSAKAGQTALQAFAMIGNTLADILITKAIEFAITAFDNYIHRVEKANEAMNNAVGEYESARSSLENVNSALEEHNQKVDELLTKDKLTYAEEGQLEELQAITKELLLQQDIEEKRVNYASKEAAEKAVDAFQKQYGKYDKTEDELTQKLSQETYHNPQDEDDVLGNIAAYIRAKELYEKSQIDFQNALKNGEDTTWLAYDVQSYTDMTDDFSQALNNNISDLQGKRVALKDEYNNAIEKRDLGLESLTSSEKDIIETYESINDLIRLVYEYTDPNAWKSMQIESVFDTKGIEKTKEELIEMVKEGTLDESTIQAYAKLSDALAQNGVSASELYQELKALAELEDYVIDDTFNPISITPSDTINLLNTQIKPALDSLKSAWQDIFPDDGFALNSIDIISTCDSIKSKLDELNELEGITVDYSAYEHFIDVLNNSDSTVENVQESFNNLASSITQAGLSGAEDFETMKAALEDLGVVNEELVAFDALISNVDALKETGLDLASATDEQIASFAAEMVSAENLMQAIDMLTFTKLASNAANMDTSTEVSNLRTLAENAGYTGDVIQYLTELEGIYQGLTSGTIPSADIPGKLERAKELTALIQESASNIKYEPEIDYSNATKSAAKAGKEAGKSYSDALKEELSNLNDVVGAIGNIINNQIDLYNDQKDAAVDALEAQKEAAEEALEAEKALVQEQIDAKQAEIDKIREAAEARKNEIDLQQKQYELARLQNQRTILVYSEDKGMHYVEDTKEIRNAKEAVTEAQENIQIAGLEKEISGLEGILDSLDQKIEESNQYYDDLIAQTEQYWDSLIKGLEDYKSRWDELTEIEEQAKVLMLLEQMGISTDDVLNMSESAFQGFKESYLGLLGEMYAGNNKMVDSLSRITGVDMSSLNGYLATTKESIDALQDTDLSNLSDGFDSLAISAGNISSAINGSGGGSVESSESGASPVTASSGSSLKSAIQDQTEAAVEDLTTQKELFSGDEGLAGAVQEVINKVGSNSGGEGSNGGTEEAEGDGDNLLSAIQQQTEEALNEDSGIPAQKRAWEELNEPLSNAVEHITTIQSTLEGLDGKTFTVTLNVTGNGSSLLSGEIGGTYGGGSSDDKSSERSHSHGGGGRARVYGTAYIEGTANAKGNWGAKEGGRTLVGELGQELWVHSADGTFETVGDNGAEFINIKPNDIIFNHLQTKQLLNKGNIIGRGKSYARGTAYAGGIASGNANNTFDGHVLKPIHPGDSIWELQKRFEPLLQKINGNLEYLSGNAMIEHTRQLEKMISPPNTTSAVTNKNIQPVVNQNIALNCPNVTNNSGVEYIQKELGHLSQMAMQEPLRKY